MSFQLTSIIYHESDTDIVNIFRSVENATDDAVVLVPIYKFECYGKIFYTTWGSDKIREKCIIKKINNIVNYEGLKNFSDANSEIEEIEIKKKGDSIAKQFYNAFKTRESNKKIYFVADDEQIEELIENIKVGRGFQKIYDENTINKLKKLGL